MYKILIIVRTLEDVPALNISVVEFNNREQANAAGRAILKQSPGNHLYLFAVALYE